MFWLAPRDVCQKKSHPSGIPGLINLNTTTKPVEPAANKQPPAHEIRVNGVRATLGKNEPDKGPRFNTPFERSDKDGEEWETSNAFGRDDLLILGFTASTALDWLNER